MRADRCEDLRREHSSIPLPRLVAVRKDGPGEAQKMKSLCQAVNPLQSNAGDTP